MLTCWHRRNALHMVKYAICDRLNGQCDGTLVVEVLLFLPLIMTINVKI